MSKEEIQTFLMSGTLTGKLSTVRKDGLPHVVPGWFILDNDDTDKNVVFTTGQDSMRAKHMLRDPRVGLCVDDQDPPFSFAIIELKSYTITSDSTLFVSSTITLSAASRK